MRHRTARAAGWSAVRQRFATHCAHLNACGQAWTRQRPSMRKSRGAHGNRRAYSATTPGPPSRRVGGRGARFPADTTTRRARAAPPRARCATTAIRDGAAAPRPDFPRTPRLATTPCTAVARARDHPVASEAAAGAAASISCRYSDSASACLQPPRARRATTAMCARPPARRDHPGPKRRCGGSGPRFPAVTLTRATCARRSLGCARPPRGERGGLRAASISRSIRLGEHVLATTPQQRRCVAATRRHGATTPGPTRRCAGSKPDFAVTPTPQPLGARRSLGCARPPRGERGGLRARRLDFPQTLRLGERVPATTPRNNGDLLRATRRRDRPAGHGAATPGPTRRCSGLRGLDFPQTL